MASNPHDGAADPVMDEHLTAVKRRVTAVLSRSPLQHTDLELGTVVAGGKMLRSRLVFRVGSALGTPVRRLVEGAVAVEMVHAASLLHDDVIDGGRLRRNGPAFWVRNGTPAAILVGDLLLCEAIQLAAATEDGDLGPALIRLTAEVCRAEVEQELVRRGQPADWETSLGFARRKTGSLFAFAGRVAAGNGEALGQALQEAGFLAGTAYQVSDDVLDRTGNSREAGKSLGSDEARGKVTAARAAPEHLGPALDLVDRLRSEAAERVEPHPKAAAAWRRYWDLDLGPALRRNLSPEREALAAG